MLLVLRSNKMMTHYHGKWSCRDYGYVLAFHNVAGRAITLPHFEPTTIRHANSIMGQLERDGYYEGH